MRNWKSPIVAAGLALALLFANVGIAGAYFNDGEASTLNGFAAWVSTLWRQTTQAHFDAGVLNNVDTATSPGDVRVANTLRTVTDSFDDETKIASKTNLVVTGGQVRLSLLGPLILRPNGPGYQTGLSRYPNTGEANWQNVDEVTSDGDTSYNYRSSGTWTQDVYALQDGDGLGQINSITTWVRVRAVTSPAAANAQHRIRTGGSNYDGTAFTTTMLYLDYSRGWTNNPRTLAAWTWADINALEAGVRLTNGGTGNQTRVTQLWVVVDRTAYSSSGTLTSTNLLSGIEGTPFIRSFSYNVPTIPSGTSLRAQFSQDQSTWYNSSGTAGGWDTLSQGAHTLSLSALGWSGSSFYYRAQFTSSGIGTPVLEEIGVNYTQNYGTIASAVLDTEAGGTNWDSLCWDRTLPSGTGISFEARASDSAFTKDAASPSWVAVGSASPVVSGLPSGRYMQWRATLATTNPSNTPALHEVRSYYY